MRDNNGQHPSVEGAPNYYQSFFTFSVGPVGEGAAVSERLFRLISSNAMALPQVPDVVLVPVELDQFAAPW
jgi:hypothetical protein